MSAYECGFNPFADARAKFEVRFFMIALLFLVSDLEIAFLLPWVIFFFKFPSFLALGIFFFFLVLLVFAFFFEWSKGAISLE